MRALHATIQRSENCAALQRIFSPTVFRELASKGRSQTLRELICEMEMPITALSSITVSELFDAAFSILRRRAYRSEYVYKAALTHKVLMGIHNLNTATLLSEFRVDSSKADIVVLNGASTAYEIKSERDKLDRLPKQIADYSRVFKYINVIGAECHINALKEILPAYVGILCLNNRFQITTVRGASCNIANIQPETILDSINLREASKILEKIGVDVPEVPNTERYRLLKEIFGTLEKRELQDAFVEVVKESRSSRSLSDFIQRLPYSLRPTGIMTNLKKREQAALIAVLEQPAENIYGWI